MGESHLQQVFQNLIGNALKYRSDACSSNPCLGESTGAAAWRFSVQDNGIGIDPQYKEKIFGVFKRLHRDQKYSGTGIGLAICQRVVERYGGRIWVESETRKRSNLLLHRPANIPSESVPPRLNLLLAEDNLPDALLVREAIRMERLPLEVHVAPDGERAIDFIAQAENDPNAPCPHVLLLDINLPKVDGFEVLRRIRASDRCGNVPVLMVSSSDSPIGSKPGRAAGRRLFPETAQLRRVFEAGRGAEKTAAG